MKCIVTHERWSGHGEGGVLVHLTIVDWGRTEPYHSTPEDIALAEHACHVVNAALAAFKSGSSPQQTATFPRKCNRCGKIGQATRTDGVFYCSIECAD